MKPRIGMVGIGLMGHGIARNIVKHGYSLVVLDHPGNQPLDELLAGGARVLGTAAEVARASDVVILCVTGTPEVEAVLTAEKGLLQGLRAGSIVVDCSTAVPASSQRMAELVAQAGGRFIDAPMTRTAKDAHEGRLNLLVGADADLFEEVKPVLDSFAENVRLVGDTGAGHSMKLLHNFISLGFMALLAEAAACAEHAGIDAEIFLDVLAQGGGNSVALTRIRPAILSGDYSATPFYMSNALKDLGYYVTMANDNDAADRIAAAVKGTFEKAVEDGGARCQLLELSRLLAANHGRGVMAA
ncbi:NAD(P)-dependent oxidoreductase [Cupriavidus sp. a3]|uniref:NAD(P)-dependent oxidoreductase n=1 Tax=Cupriavidus sp. a3 TaxID=3242158 RepID=UPI003D9C3AFE